MKYPVSPPATTSKIFGRTTFKFNKLYHYIKMLFNFTKVNNSYIIKRLFHKTPFFATRNWRWWPVCFLNFFNHIWQRCDYRFMKKQWCFILSITSSLKNFIRVNIWGNSQYPRFYPRKGFYSEAYSEAYQTSKIDRFAKLFTGF